MKDELKNIKHAITLLQKAVAQLEGRLDVDTAEKQRKRFVPPIIDVAEMHYRECRYNFDLDEWFNHYNTNGWMVGKNKMTSWQSSMAQWEARWKKKNPERKTVRLDAHGRPLNGNGQERLL